jgi:hypothetical protein
MNVKLIRSRVFLVYRMKIQSNLIERVESEFSKKHRRRVSENSSRGRVRFSDSLIYVFESKT